MLRVVEEFHLTDVGRHRSANEDDLFVRVPLFVVADGMGGAQAGEVASKTAVEVFEDELPGGDPADVIVERVREANRKINELAAAHSEYAGMGTTCTAAYVTEDDRLVVAHVGDSRCYLWRDGDLVRLTKDHSLVGELVARGRLTEEQAESHPQRSVITRALGAESDVRVDREVYEAKAGDVVLLCSDGLTTMVTERQIETVLEIGGPLAPLGRGLVYAANAAGGKDNITVIMFRLGEADPEATPAPVVSESDPEPESEPQRTAERDLPDEDITLVGESALRTEDVHAAVAEAEAAEPPPRTARLPVAEAPMTRREPPSATDAPRRRRRIPTALIVSTVLLAIVLFAAWSATRAVYFVGTDDSDQRTITIFRGLPYELPAGLKLYERVTGSGLTLEAIPARRRKAFTSHKLRSRDDAEDLVAAAEKGALDE
jgi:protein phosphatase